MGSKGDVGSFGNRGNGKYYLFFGANDIQSDEERGGIGIAVAETPEGPYRDLLGRPLIDKFHNLPGFSPYLNSVA